MHQHELESLRTAADNGDPEAQYRLAMRYIYGDGVEEDNALAFSLLTSAAENGHMEAAYNLAICYHYGYGTTPNLQKAYHLYRQSAEQRYGKGCCLVGEFHLAGLWVQQDCEEGVRWFQKALESDDITAVAYGELLLGRCCETGKGLPLNLENAREWYKRSAEHGDDRGKAALTRLQTH